MHGGGMRDEVENGTNVEDGERVIRAAPNIFPTWPSIHYRRPVKLCSVVSPARGTSLSSARHWHKRALPETSGHRTPNNASPEESSMSTKL